MSNNKPQRAAAPKSAPQPVDPAWDKPTWMKLSNVRLGVPPYVIAGALCAFGDSAVLTEAEVRRCLQNFLNQSL